MSSPPPSPPAFHDDYDHPDDRIEYLLENTLMPAPPADQRDAYAAFTALADLHDSHFTVACDCTTACTASCPCSRGSAVNYTATGRLNPLRSCSDLLFECSARCACPPGCGNRVVQFGPHRGMRLVPTGGKRGWGVRCAAEHGMPAGTFVCEYAGELLTAPEARRRHADEYAGTGVNYVMCLNERRAAAVGEDGGDGGDGGGAAAVRQTFVDPTRRGNVGRYLNHSCEPNCEILSVRIGGPIPRLGEYDVFFLFLLYLVGAKAGVQNATKMR